MALQAVSPNRMTSLMRSSCCAAWQDSKCATHAPVGAASQPHPTLTPSQRPTSKLHLWVNQRVKFAAHGFGGTCQATAQSGCFSGVRAWCRCGVMLRTGWGRAQTSQYIQQSHLSEWEPQRQESVTMAKEPEEAKA